MGAGVHLVLPALFGVTFSPAVPSMRTDATLLLSAGVYGSIVYVAKFRLPSPLFLPAFQEASQPFDVPIHVAYGQILALIYSARPSSRSVRNTMSLTSCKGPRLRQGRATIGGGRAPPVFRLPERTDCLLAGSPQVLVSRAVEAPSLVGTEQHHQQTGGAGHEKPGTQRPVTNETGVSATDSTIMTAAVALARVGIPRSCSASTTEPVSSWSASAT